MGAYTPAFITAINFVLSPDAEGAGTLNTDATDPGNWTGGAQGKGALVGTRWGLSAAAYPKLDIKGITREQAVAIYQRDFWMPIKGDLLPQRLALVVLDAAVNQGVDAAVRALQAALRVPEDGVCGPQTTAAARSVADVRYAVADFLAVRGVRYAKDKNFQRFGQDWLRRCFLGCQAAS